MMRDGATSGAVNRSALKNCTGASVLSGAFTDGSGVSARSPFMQSMTSITPDGPALWQGLALPIAHAMDGVTIRQIKIMPIKNRIVFNYSPELKNFKIQAKTLAGQEDLMSDNLKYTKDHEWLKLEGGTVAVIGITEYAQDALGDLVYVELPETGRKVGKGESFAVVESVKTAAEVYTPVSGEIVAVNDNLSSDPELIKKSLEEGWIAKIRISDPAEIQGLMDKSEYEAYLKTK